MRALRLVGVQREHDRRFAPILSTRCGHHRLLANSVALYRAWPRGVCRSVVARSHGGGNSFGGVILRYRALTISQSFARFFVIAAIISQFVFILFAIEENAPFLLDRPRLHPNSYLVAFVAGTNAALNLSVAAFIIRKQTGKLTPPPLP